MNLNDSILNPKRLSLLNMLKHAIHHPMYIEYKTHPSFPFQITNHLVCTLEWWYSLALSLVQGGTNNLSVT